jgi:hypothetical protein
MGVKNLVVRACDFCKRWLLRLDKSVYCCSGDAQNRRAPLLCGCAVVYGEW